MPVIDASWGKFNVSIYINLKTNYFTKILIRKNYSGTRKTLG